MNSRLVLSPLDKLNRLRDGATPGVVDLFSGCGGMSLGLRRAGCEIRAGIEKEDVRARTHALNFHPDEQELHGHGRDITAEDPVRCVSRLAGGPASVDLIVGGPPCQAYARVGRAKLREIGKHPTAYLKDTRGSLYAAYVAWVAALQPIAVVMENVPDILSYGGTNVAEIIAGNLDELGYECRYTLLNAAHYGVPQTRERWFLVGIHRSAGVEPVFPQPTHALDLPIGYKGTRAHAHRWGLPGAERPAHAVPLLKPASGRRQAIGCRNALKDLPVITAEEKASLKRGPRKLDVARRYERSATTAYQRLMRSWDGFSTRGSVTAHVIRALPRDYAIFERMKAGDDYPAAHKVALELFEERLTASGTPIRAGSKAWLELRKATVPPYDPGKFPNKWRKLEDDFPSRTLLAHLSHDGYSHIHYDSAQARTISVREAARLQSFPDGFEFAGAMNAAFGQIGNAVPPLVAAAIGSQLLGQLRAERRDPVRKTA